MHTIMASIKFAPTLFAQYRKKELPKSYICQLTIASQEKKGWDPVVMYAPLYLQIKTLVII